MLAIYVPMLVIFFASRSLTDDFGYRGVSALTLNTRMSRLWEESSAIIHKTAQQRLCGDGSAPKVERIQLDGQLTTYELQCNERSWRNTNMDAGELYKRQAELCMASCSTDCYHPADYNPNPSDCSDITALLRSRDGMVDVTVGGTSVVRSGTCVFTLTNQSQYTLSFCNSAWALIGDSITSGCGPGLANPAKGGICTGSNFYITAVRTPDMPVSSSTSTISTTGSSESPRSSSNSAASSSLSSSSQSISSTATTGTTNGNARSGTSTVSYETLHDLAGGIAVASGLMPESSIITSIGDPQLNDHRRMDIAAIVGGTIGGVAAVILLLAAFFIIRHVRRYDATRSEKSDQLAPTFYVTSSRPTSFFTNSHPPMTSTSSAFNVATGSQNGSGTLFADFESMLATHAATRNTLSIQQELPAYSATRNNNIISMILNSPDNTLPMGVTMLAPTVGALIAAAAPPETSQEQIDLITKNFLSLMRGFELPALTVEVLIAGSAPPEMSQEQTDLLAANFISLVSGRQTLGEGSQHDEDASEVRQPPPYQQQ